MEKNSNNGGLLPSAMALKNSLNQKPATSFEQTMLTPSQQELLRQFEREIDEYFALSPQLDVLFEPPKTLAAAESK